MRHLDRWVVLLLLVALVSLVVWLWAGILGVQ